MKAAIVKTATLKTLVSSLVLLGGLSQVAHADANPNLVQAGTSLEGNLTGNIGVYSKYVLRGITNAPEQDGAAVQGGVDYVLKNGF
ncbi:MAG TPA: TorF family putative porin, partial [Aquirhabdus sp.]